MKNLKELSDESIVGRLAELARAERKAQVELLRYLGELSERRLYLQLGYSSLWDYCRRALGFSESVSKHRITVARAAARHPELLDKLADGRLTICTAADLVPLLEGEGAKDLIIAAEGKSRREVQALGVAPGAKPVERDLIRRVPAATMPRNEVASAKVDKPAAEPARHRVAFTASDDVVKKLEKLQALLGDASLEEVVEKAAELLLAKVDPEQRQGRREERQARAKKAPVAAKPRSRPSIPRRPPAALRDLVLTTAGQRCEFVSAAGVRCNETRHLSVDHIRPYALGGTSTDRRNLRCLCMAHSLYLGRKTFGPRPTSHL